MSDSLARLKAAVDYARPRSKSVTVRVTDVEAAIDEIEAWRTKLSQVMPPDFKDWFENEPSQWPDVAAQVIMNLRREVDYWSSDC